MIDYLNTKPEEVRKISDLKKMADYWFRQYLLHIAERDWKGRIKCPLTNKWLYQEDLHVCHYIDRAVMHLRYDLNNCILCSRRSNYWDAKLPAEDYKSLHHKQFEEYLGEEKTSFLKEDSKKIVILRESFYVNNINKWRTKILSQNSQT